MQTPPRDIGGSPGGTAMPTITDAQQPFSRKHPGSPSSQPDCRPSNARHSHSPSSTPIDDATRGARAVKRDDPLPNMENKYVCDFADDCHDLAFDTKHKWRQHISEHDRPYRCQNPAYANLQGFTHSGGLLRHEREVHGKHGEPELMCPVPDGKRRVCKDFTRKEYLNEHLSRVHSTRDQPSQDPNFKREVQDILNYVDGAEGPTLRISKVADSDDASMMSPALGKRKRSSLPGVSERVWPRARPSSTTTNRMVASPISAIDLLPPSQCGIISVASGLPATLSACCNSSLSEN